MVYRPVCDECGTFHKPEQLCIDGDDTVQGHKCEACVEPCDCGQVPCGLCGYCIEDENIRSQG